MNILDRVATFNKYESWESMVDKITKRKVKFNIPNYMHYNNSELIHSIILNGIKNSNLKLTTNKSELSLLISK